MKSKTYTQSKRPLDKNQSSKFCQSGVKQTHFQNLKEKRKWFFLSQGHFKELKALFPGFLRLLESPGGSRVRPFFPGKWFPGLSKKLLPQRRKTIGTLHCARFAQTENPFTQREIPFIRSLLRSARFFFLVRLGQYLNSVAPSVSLELAPCLVECLKLLHTHFFNVKLKRWGRNSSATTACTFCIVRILA